ncbi:Eco57I restriction-modification methylase domain-containing protein [Halocatena pleomorpha]|uniref:site-specific DNA-methyltransferase (adenine-specific) n=1 Tax=Halocatena pleomorpha TaxID=1785090 RepID=A0A3P3RGG0_9EURY|nr:TaqI-like C-terminal specificity domain-containing protein [Halocatena pleomorpha]RRJ31523.1 class I SAM-dependent DNA methyltransferase [Halocatena pleomorpha]
MQTVPAVRTSCDLFSNYYLDEHLPKTEAWNDTDEKTVRAVYDDIKERWEHEKRTTLKHDEAQSNEQFIRGVFRELGVPFGAEDHADRGQCRLGDGFFTTGDAATAFERREEVGDFYENAIVDVKPQDRPLDINRSDEHREKAENPSYQIHVYLQETSARWAVLTNGRRWRLYHDRTSHRLDSYYEVDLPALIERDMPEEFKYFYLFFRTEAFLEDDHGNCFLDDVCDESRAVSQELKEDVQDNVYRAIEVLSEGFLRYPDNDLGEDDLDLIHDGTIVYLYRLIFVLYAEAEDRVPLDTSNERYEQSYSLNSLKQEVTAELDSSDPKYRSQQNSLQSRLHELFTLIGNGSTYHEISEEELYVPAYNGGLFRTDPNEDDRRETRFLADHDIGDVHLARAIELLTRRRTNDGTSFIDYTSLDVRHLGSIYEELLEYNSDIAAEPLTLDGGEYASAEEDDDVVVRKGDVYLRTDSGERKATGAFYTPEYVVEYIVGNTLGPLVNDIREDVMTRNPCSDQNFAAEFAERVFDLNVLDPAMGSGHFLTSAVDYLAREIIGVQEAQVRQQGIGAVEEERDIDWARRQVIQHCIYGVDQNPLAVELAKVSLWLRTLDADQPLAFLDHRLKTGNALLGSDIEELDYQDVVANENRDPADVSKIASKYDEFEQNALRERLEAVANVRTAETVGLDDLPNDAYERMAAALEDDRRWQSIERAQWFQDAQELAVDDEYFHWKLEFPTVFYDDSGNKRPDAGFDAVIGNPPYIRSRTLPEAHKTFYKNRYRSAHGAYDIYVPFLERAVELGNRCSFIVPNKWTTTSYGEGIRELLLEEYELHELVDISRLDVFSDADIYPLIISYSSTDNTDSQKLSIRHVEDPNDIDSTSPVTLSRDIIDQLGSHIIPVNLTPDFVPIIEKALSQSQLGDHIEMTEAIHTGNIREKLVVDENVGDSCEKLADGTSIDRYHVEWSGRWIRYDEDVIDNELGEYGDLRTRSVFDASEKLFIRDISYHPVAAYDADQLFALNTLYSVRRKNHSSYGLKYLLAVFNSKFVDRYFRQVYGGTHVSGDYLRFKPMFAYKIPIPEPDELADEHERRLVEFDPTIDVSSTVAAIEDLTDIIREAKDSKSDLNPSIVDVLGDYSDGKAVTDIAGYRSPTGVSSSLLSETTRSRKNLRVGSVAVRTDDETLTIAVSARYKPDDDDEFETDRWGYTETSVMPAMEFVGVERTERLLLREFVPYAIEAADGFAGFRNNATKTNSLIDRLEEITLPKISDIGDELRRYREQRREADRMNERIETADRILDEIIYDLYGLTGDEKETLEETGEFHG